MMTDAGGSKKVKPTRGFAPMPFRAFGDVRLKRAHLAVLGVIGAHDRFTANGRGCDIGRDRIAYLAALDIATTSRTISDLANFGYVAALNYPGDGRRRTYIVIYTDEDGALLSKKSNPTEARKVTHTSPSSIEKGDAPVTEFAEIGDVSDTERAEIGDIEKRQGVDFVTEADPNIFPERGKIFTEGENIPRREKTFPERAHSAECVCANDLVVNEKQIFRPRKTNRLSEQECMSRIERAPKTDPKESLERERAQKIGQELRRIEAEIRAGAIPESSKSGLRDWLTQVGEDYEGHLGDPIGGWALRLAGELS